LAGPRHEKKITRAGKKNDDVDVHKGSSDKEEKDEIQEETNTIWQRKKELKNTGLEKATKTQLGLAWRKGTPG